MSSQAVLPLSLFVDNNGRHIKYTIPPACALTLIYWPLFDRIAFFKVAFLITVSSIETYAIARDGGVNARQVAFVATVPWDSYLLRAGIWTYPTDAVLGYDLLRIPVEELFFFVIQTYNTSLLYLLISTATFHPEYLQPASVQSDEGGKSSRFRTAKLAGHVLLVTAISMGIKFVYDGGSGTYMGLILVWALPILLLLWYDLRCTLTG